MRLCDPRPTGNGEMRGLFRLLLIGIGALVLLLVVAVIAVTLLFDANSYRGQLSAQVKSSTGLDLRVGDLRLSWFPTLGARVQNLSLGNPPGYGDQPMAQVGEAELGVRILPLLLHRQVRIGSVKLKDARIDLIRDPRGHGNWEALNQAAQVPANGAPPAPAQAAQPSPAEARQAVSGFEVSSVDVENAAVKYEDLQLDKTYEVKQFSLKLGALAPQVSSACSLTFSADQSDPQVHIDFSASANLAIDLPAQTFGLNKLKLEVKAAGSGLSVGQQDVVLTGDGRYSGKDHHGTIDNLVIKADPSTASGSLSFGGGEAPSAQLLLKIDQLDLDRYLPQRPPEQQRAQQPLTQSVGTGEPDQPLPVDALDLMSAMADIDIGALQFKGMKMTAVQLRVKAPKGQEKSIDFDARLYGGTLSAQTRVQPGRTPGYGQATKLSAVDVGALLQDYKSNASVSGILDFSLAVTSSGRSAGQIKQGLNGTASLQLRNGAVKGFDLPRMLRQGQDLLSGHSAPSAGGQTEFSSLTATGRITNGVLHSDDLLGESPLLRVQGAGEVDLAHGTVDYLVKPTLVNTTTGQGGKPVADLEGLVVPVRVSGPLSAPHYAIDVAAALQHNVVDPIGRQLDKGGGGLLDAVKGLFGGHGSDPKSQPSK